MDNLIGPKELQLTDQAICISERNNHRIQKFSNAGAYLLKWGSLGSGTTQLEEPAGIATDGSNVYVCDRKNDRIQVYSTSGAHLSSFGTSGSTPSQFDEPRGIWISSGGCLYVSDKGNDRIQVFGGSLLCTCILPIGSGLADT